MRSMNHQIEAVHAIAAQVVTSGGGAVNSGDVDRQGAEGLEFLLNVGANGGDTLNGTNHFEVKVEHADDDGTGSPGAYEAVAADDVTLVASAPVQAPDASGIIIDIDDAAEDDASYKFGYVGDRRFVKVTVTPQGTLTNGNPMSLTGIKHRLSHRV